MYTTAQAMTCVQLCYNLTNTYSSVDLVALDQRSGKLIILSRETINIEIDPDGEWRFTPE